MEIIGSSERKFPLESIIDEYEVEMQISRPDFGEETDLMKCPQCPGIYSHFIGVEEIPGEDTYRAWEGRGDLIRIKYRGECGHNWAIEIGYHKGQNFIRVSSEQENFDFTRVKELLHNTQTAINLAGKEGNPTSARAYLELAITEMFQHLESDRKDGIIARMVNLQMGAKKLEGE